MFRFEKADLPGLDRLRPLWQAALAELGEDRGGFEACREALCAGTAGGERFYAAVLVDLAGETGRDAGFVAVSYDRGASCGRVEMLYLDPEYRAGGWAGSCSKWGCPAWRSTASGRNGLRCPTAAGPPCGSARASGSGHSGWSACCAPEYKRKKALRLLRQAEGLFAGMQPELQKNAGRKPIVCKIALYQIAAKPAREKGCIPAGWRGMWRIFVQCDKRGGAEGAIFCEMPCFHPPGGNGIMVAEGRKSGKTAGRPAAKGTRYCQEETT